MGKKQEKDELEGVEAVPREQAEQEMQSAVEKLHSQQGQGASKKAARSGKGGDAEKDEMADVEAIPREQAEKEMHEAASKVKKTKDKKKG